MNRKLDGKIALITGGTTGIGLSTARLFREHGATVIVTGSSAKSVDEAKRQLNGTATVLQSDAGDPAAIRALVAEIAGSHGRLDVIFANAGIGLFAPLADLGEDAFDKMVAINLKGPWFLVKEALPHLPQGASIVFNTSVVNVKGFPGTTAYALSKAGLRSLARTAAAELLSRGIRVNAVSPGPIETPIYHKLGMPPAETEGFMKTMAESNPMKRFGKPEEVANAVLFLASDDSSYMTGGEIAVDGGLSHL